MDRVQQIQCGAALHACHEYPTVRRISNLSISRYNEAHGLNQKAKFWDPIFEKLINIQIFGENYRYSLKWIGELCLEMLG